jgi:hypothetical protein
MGRSEVENGRIESTHLGLDDHGIPTWWLNLTFPSSGQGFGGYDLRVYGIALLMKIISTVGAENWEGLFGKYVRVRRDDSRGFITAIGHIVEDKWLDMTEEQTKIASQKEVVHG